MTSHLFLAELPAVLAAGGKFELTGDEAKHAISVRRLRVGEELQLTDGKGRRAQATVAAIEARSLICKIEAIELETRPKPLITLVQALAKSDRDEMAVQICTELGVSAIIPWQADRSISRWDEAKARKNQDRWQSIAIEATKQSLQSWAPSVPALVSTKQLVASISEFDLVLVLEPSAPAGIATALDRTNLSALERVALIIGPEGGVSESESVALREAGAIGVNLGAPVLRTSTAGAVALTILLSKLDRYN